ncbi:Fungal Zn2-Cys6 binuclear cluster domain-containing protein [Cladophialophora immunda]|nr:Fungal Zn2-Cys6 binuclear cluster domain-containing protein [Cladophialophora immunda]
MGYKSTEAQLLTIPIYAAACITCLLVGYFSDRLRKRAPFVFGCYVAMLTGYIMCAAPRHFTPGLTYAGIMIAACGLYSVIPGLLAWFSNNLAPVHKRSVAMALQIGLGTLAGAAASNFYVASDAPTYRTGHTIELAFVSMGLVLVIAYYISCSLANKKRAKMSLEMYTNQQLAELGDKSPAVSDTCRRRHIKCDEQSPVCRRCEESNRECLEASLFSQWRRDRRSIAGDAVHSDTQLTFVAENVDVTSPEIQTADEEVTETSAQIHEQIQDESACWVDEEFDSERHGTSSPPQSSIVADVDLSRVSPSLTSLTALISASTFNPAIGLMQPADDPRPFLPALSTSGSPELDILSEATSSTRAVAIETPRLKDRVEALLFRHYVENLAPWFDVTDPRRHFQIHVPERALESDVLLDAIFALSALNIGRLHPTETTQRVDVDPVLSEVYHTRCIGKLISLMNDKDTAIDEDVLSAAVILRKFEEMNVHIIGQDRGHHLLGVAALFNSRSCAMTGRLAEAAFWQFVRQDAYMALFTHQPPRIDFTKQDFFFSLSEASDSVWANRIVFSTVMVISYCFSGTAKSVDMWQDLTDQVDMWDAQKPASFRPIFAGQPAVAEGRHWPEILFYTPWHATGMQYYHLAKLLLCLYSPYVPPPGVGLEYARAHRTMRETVLFHTRALCGIAQSGHFVTTRFFMCPIMQMCGGWFTDPDEQHAILDLLHQAENANGWPTKRTTESLMRHWLLETPPHHGSRVLPELSP